MLRILHDHSEDGDDLASHARYLLREVVKKDKLPRVAAATRALVPDWCDYCEKRCWGQVGSMFALCSKCRGEGKRPIGFGD